MLRLFIPLGFLLVFAGWILYRLLIKKDLKKNLNAVYLSLFFFGVWAGLYFLLLK